MRCCCSRLRFRATEEESLSELVDSLLLSESDEELVVSVVVVAADESDDVELARRRRLGFGLGTAAGAALFFTPPPAAAVVAGLRGPSACCSGVLRLPEETTGAGSVARALVRPETKDDRVVAAFRTSSSLSAEPPLSGATHMLSSFRSVMLPGTPDRRRDAARAAGEDEAHVLAATRAGWNSTPFV
jgi:hypothetical protein